MQKDKIIGQRINVVGVSGSGKTTTAKHIAERLQIPHFGLDALHWGPNWTEPPIDKFREIVSDSLMASSWVVDGNYGKVRDIVWPQADTIVWLDYSLSTIMWQLIKRTIRRVVLRKLLWGGNHESLSTALFSKDSIYLWVLRPHKGQKIEHPQRFALKENAHLHIIHLKNPLQAKRFLDQIIIKANNI